MRKRKGLYADAAWRLASGRRTLSGFTLIELLVVIAIMVILLGLIVPAFKNIGGTWALDAAGNRVASLLNSARQNSAAKNAETALLLLTDPQLENHHRVLGMFELLPRPDGSAPVSDDWRQIGKWELLDQGIITNTNCTFTSSAVQPTPPLPVVSYGGTPVGSYQYVIYLPGGKYTGSSTAFIQLVEGFFPANSTAPAYTRKGASGTYSNYYSITILNSTGYPKIDRP